MTACDAASGREEWLLDRGWLFHLGDVPAPVPPTHLGAYMHAKAGYAGGAARRGFDDSDWRVLDLPHDWSHEGEFDPSLHTDAGYLPRGIAWYRRRFTLDPRDRGSSFLLRFDAVGTHCTVYVNGHLVHRNFGGYTPFDVDITDVVEFDDEPNVVAVRVDATTIEGWWYEGAGIYRHAWLVKAPRVRLAEDGVFVCPQRASSTRWDVRVRATIENTSDRDAEVELLTEIVDAPGGPGDRHRLVVRARCRVEVERTIPLDNPRPWSVDEPSLYTLRCTLASSPAGEPLAGDRVEVPFGCRTIRFDAELGFFLNDRPMKLLGACCHQDHAGVGVAVPDSLWEFRVRRLKEFGFNAIRCAHHPPARGLLDACDRLGMLVMDENRLFGSSPEHLRQLSAMVRRDRNHPSVILWCLCNEEAVQGEPVSARIARSMSAEVRRLDPSRPITAAISGGTLNDDSLADAVDVVGVNYQVKQYDTIHAKRPGVPMVASETHCVLATRGVDHTEPSRQVFADDDSEHASWSCSARETWRAVSSRPFVAGLFAWTGFDYRGEPAPHAWPSVSSHWGLLDLCGFEKNVAHLHRAWFTSEPFVFIAGHWNAGPFERRVAAYTNAEEVELLLNGVSLGRQRVDPIDMASWRVNYVPGELRAIAYRAGNVVAETSRQTTGEPATLGLEVHPSMGRSRLRADGADALPVTVFATDVEGRRVPDATPEVEIVVSGAARLLGTGNGDPNSHEPSTGHRRRLFAGLAQAIIQAREVPGIAIVEARSPGLGTARLEIQVQRDLPVLVGIDRPVLPPAPTRWFVNDFRMSPPLASRPDPSSPVPESDVNSWPMVRAGQPQAVVSASGYVLFRGSLRLPRRYQASGALLRLHEVRGSEVEVWLDEQPVRPRGKEPSKRIDVQVPPSTEKRWLTVLVRAEGSRCGLAGRVEVVVSS